MNRPARMSGSAVIASTTVRTMLATAGRRPRSCRPRCRCRAAARSTTAMPTSMQRADDRVQDAALVERVAAGRRRPCPACRSSRWMQRRPALDERVDDGRCRARAPTTTAAPVHDRRRDSRSTTTARGLRQRGDRRRRARGRRRTSRRRSRAMPLHGEQLLVDEPDERERAERRADRATTTSSSVRRADAARDVVRGPAAVGRRPAASAAVAAASAVAATASWSCGHQISVAAPLRLRLTKTAAIVLTPSVMTNSTKPAVEQRRQLRRRRLAEAAGDQRRDVSRCRPRAAGT